MASTSDIAAVRLNTNEPEAETFSDEYLGGLIDASGVTGASATVWEQKAASLSDEVDVTEAGASHKFSGLFTQAQKMADYWRAKAGTSDEGSGATEGRTRVRTINRTGL